MNQYKTRTAQLIVIEPEVGVSTHALEGEQYTIGRFGGANDISLRESFVSSPHGMIYHNGGIYVYIDLHSSNGTRLNKTPIVCPNNQPSSPVPLKDGDILSIGVPGTKNVVYMLFSSSNMGREWRTVSLSGKSGITIGRGDENDIVLPDVTVSRRHAKIAVNGGRVMISDLNSANGTLVNGNMVKGTLEFRDGDTVRITGYRIIRMGNIIAYNVQRPAVPENLEGYQRSIMKQIPEIKEPVKSYDYAKQGGVEVRVENVSRFVKCKSGTGINGGNKKCILDNVSLTIHPGDLVAILGGSGAGKTTFMNCINGFEPATEGRVLIDGTDLYKNYQCVKSSIGYVPQQDIVHDELTLEKMLTYAGRLRLPKDITKQEMSRRVAEVLDMVDLTAEKDNLVKKLSGGQRKRASIAVELISDPKLFFLDEPTSGLDPEAETNLMHRLKSLSRDKGKTVIVITHTLQNIHVFDKVIFLAPGGKLCFYGTPKEAEAFFGVENLTEAYQKISDNVDKYVKDFNIYRQKGVGHSE